MNTPMNLIYAFCLSVSLLSLTFNALAQNNPLNPKIEWSQSFQLKKDQYIFHQIKKSQDTVEILASGKKDKYLITLVNDSNTYLLKQNKMAKPAGHFVYWAGYYNQQYIEITEKQRTISEDELFLRLPNKDTFISLFHYRSDYQKPAQFLFQSDANHIYLALKPPGRNNDSTSIFILTIDSLLQLKYDTLGLHFHNDLVTLDQFEIKKDHFFFILKNYQTNKIEKRQFKRNYTFDEIKFYPMSKKTLVQPLALEKYFYYPQMRYFANYHQTVGLYSKTTDNKALGLYIYSHNYNKSYHIPFDTSIIKRTRKPHTIIKHNYIPGLFPDLIVSNDSNFTYYFEQYYITAVSGSATNATYNFHYNHLVSVTLSKDFSKPIFNTLPKYQKSYNDFGQFSSYKILKIYNEKWFFINSNKNYLQQPNKTTIINPLKYSYIINTLNYSEIIPVSANRKLPPLTELIIKDSEKSYVLFSYEKGKLWIGKLNY